MTESGLERLPSSSSHSQMMLNKYQKYRNPSFYLTVEKRFSQQCQSSVLHLTIIKKINVMTKHLRCAHLSSNHDGPGGPWLVGLLLDSWLKNIYLTVILCVFSEKQPVKEQATHGCRVWWCAGSWVAVACTRGSSSPGRQTLSWDWSSPCSALQDGQQTSSCSPERSFRGMRDKQPEKHRLLYFFSHSKFSPVWLWQHPEWRHHRPQIPEAASAGPGHGCSPHQSSNEHKWSHESVIIWKICKMNFKIFI